MKISKVPVLVFHSIDESGSVISMTPGRLKQLLLRLKQEGYQTLTLNELTAWARGEVTLTRPSVVITFDDGYENLYKHAFALLDDLGFTATVFLTTGYCGGGNQWPAQHASIGRLKMLTWQQISEMSKSAFSFQAHTRTHPDLNRLTPKQVEAELLDSRREIEGRLGMAAEYFAYPFGKPSPQVVDLTRKYFAGACNGALAFATHSLDPFLIPRLEMYYFSGNRGANLFLSPFFETYLTARRPLRAVRHLATRVFRTVSRPNRPLI